MPDNVAKVLCIFHAACADGLGAAWAVHRALGEGVEFVAARYGDMPQLSEPCKYHSTTEPCTDCLGTGYDQGGGPLLGRDILIVDFSYPLPVLRAMAREARSVLVIDHHKTAREDLRTLTPPVLYPSGWLPYQEWLEKRVPSSDPVAIFDLERSGAGLAWDYLSPHLERPLGALVKQSRPRIIDLIEDRDLWRFRFGDETRAFHAVLTSYDIGDLPGIFERLDEWDHWQKENENHGLVSPWENILDDGFAILRAQSSAVASAVAASRRTIRIAGYVVPCANVPGSMASDAGHLLCQPTDGPSTPGYTDSIIVDDGAAQQNWPLFSATYYDAADGKRHFSLRAPLGSTDVSDIARIYGGGGHKSAAGFTTVIGWEGE